MTTPSRRGPWLGLAVAAMGGLWLQQAHGIAATTSFIGIGPSFMVNLAGGGLLVLGLLLAWHDLRAPRGEEAPQDGAAPFARAPFL